MATKLAVKKVVKKKAAKRGKGRPTVMTPDKEKEILAILSIGGSRNIACDYVGIGYATLSRRIESSQVFSEQVKKAEATGQLKHIKKVDAADQWQASAWMLERKWPDEFGRRDKTELTGKDGSPLVPSQIKIVHE